jgi:hypothetical protein
MSSHGGGILSLRAINLGESTLVRVDEVMSITNSSKLEFVTTEMAAVEIVHIYCLSATKPLQILTTTTYLSPK